MLSKEQIWKWLAKCWLRLDLNTQCSEVFQDDFFYFMSLNSVGDRIWFIFHLLYFLPFYFNTHVRLKNGEKWFHFCESSRWAQSQYCAQHLPLSVPSRVHNSRCGCKCTAVCWRPDGENKGNKISTSFPSSLQITKRRCGECWKQLPMFS